MRSIGDLLYIDSLGKLELYRYVLYHIRIHGKVKFQAVRLGSYRMQYYLQSVLELCGHSPPKLGANAAIASPISFRVDGWQDLSSYEPAEIDWRVKTEAARQTA